MKITQLSPDDHILDEFGQRLAQIRKQRGLSQQQLADQAGIGVATLRRIEDGSDSQLGSWIKLLKALNMSAAIDALLPEHFQSPMAETLSNKKRSKTARTKKTKDASTGIIWGDESA